MSRAQKIGARGERALERRGLKRTSGSGNQGEKGDLRYPGEDWMAELKTTTAASWSLKLDDLRKLDREAALAGMRALFIVRFEKYGREYAVVPMDTFEELKDDNQDRKAGDET